MQLERIKLKIGSIGKSLKNSNFCLLDKNGKLFNKPYKIGELIYFGKNVSLGYAYSIKDLKKGDANKGKLYTGDLAYKDNDGYYYIFGRINRMSKIFGVRINLDDIEKKLDKNSFKVKCIPDNNYLKIQVLSFLVNYY